MQIRPPFSDRFYRADRDRNPNRAFVAKALTLEGNRPRVTNLWWRCTSDKENSREQRGTNIKMSKQKKKDKEKEHARETEREGDRARECVYVTRWKNASDTHENKNDYVPHRGRTCAACHAHTYAAYRRSNGVEEAGVGVCRDAGPLPRCFVI